MFTILFAAIASGYVKHTSANTERKEMPNEPIEFTPFEEKSPEQRSQLQARSQAVSHAEAELRSFLEQRSDLADKYLLLQSQTTEQANMQLSHMKNAVRDEIVDEYLGQSNLSETFDKDTLGYALRNVLSALNEGNDG